MILTLAPLPFEKIPVNILFVVSANLVFLHFSRNFVAQTADNYSGGENYEIRMDGGNAGSDGGGWKGYSHARPA